VSFGLNPLNDMVNAASTTYSGTIDGNHPINTIALPFPSGISAPPGRVSAPRGHNNFSPKSYSHHGGISANHPAGYVQQWNLNIQRALPADFFLSAVYVGSKGTHLEQYSQQINQISDALLAQAAAQVD